ncbi:DNA mismatch repair endonuclease MutL [Salibacterium salarium]|uniref:DNA mismatch repair protein MutL n=1 Tax=Salibacterium salarium TaxID=284579 RepID=A0A3R9P7U4_9BACI|nr:DNA mismatch repair endonuclease MutL [Salibacterium salarium]RSL33241.1 DNA mismatch repair endonuclease MutL [Salibacterium salarium]
MAAIKKLSDELSNKIAAGEVVERPASIVKELVENAIDAESTRVDIQIEEGGLSKIRVVDNGSGMGKEDAEIAFLRHATSKIKTERDLFKIATLGFRGEALPSIAAVSNMELETGTGDAAGTLIRYQGGKRITLSSSKGRKGTEITVRDLFFNTPARLKYMKTINTEIGNISDVVNRLALANPSVSLRLSHNNRQLLFTNGNGDIQAVLAAIYGRQTAGQFLKIDNHSVDYKVEGFAAKPEVNRASRQYISTFINGRYVKHYPLVKAIENAYHTLLPIGRHPLVVLHIQMDPVLIDVNVHPAKLEVRISKEKELMDVVETAIKTKLTQETLIPDVDQSRTKRQTTEQVPLHFEQQPSSSREQTSNQLMYGQEVSTNENQGDSFQHATRETSPAIHIQHQPQDSNMGYQDNQEMVQEQSSQHVSNEKTKQDRVPELEVIGQMHGTYILTQNENGLYIIDQHAAQERIFYEFYREKIGETDFRLQDLIVPITLELSPEEDMIVHSYKDELAEVGVFLESFGYRTHRVTTYPAWFPHGEEESTIRELLEQLMKDKKISISKLREDAAILMSCKAAIKANRYLRADEMDSLMESLRQCDIPFTCPHGRPIIIHFSGYDMEKMFKRIM